MRPPLEPERRPHILIVEDDDNLRSLLQFNLERHGFRASQAADGADGLMQARALDPDLILLDIMLPVLDGREVCRAIRRHSDVPILILTALDQEADVVTSFELGADDHVSKPFSIRELLARIDSLLRRSNARKEDSGPLAASGLTIYVKEHRAEFHGRELHLPLKEFKLLATLVGRAGEVCTREELLDTVWGRDVVVDQRNVDVRIRWLRERLEGDPDGSSLIQTVHGVGYRFVAQHPLRAALTGTLNTRSPGR
jgi:DNA-binding response OmpR family regulator